MAVKVMVAPAIANAAIAKRTSAARQGAVPAKPKRRRSSVYDADGNEVFITLLCLKCHKMRPLSQFGLRKMADGAIRNQPWCRTCRSGSGEGKAARKGPAEGVEPPAPAVPPIEVAPAPAQAAKPAEPRRASSSVAAEVAAALAAGMRR